MKNRLMTLAFVAALVCAANFVYSTRVTARGLTCEGQDCESSSYCRGVGGESCACWALCGFPFHACCIIP
jgi:hypothetical protein